MRVFITGGAGFLGSAIANELVQGGDTVELFDRALHDHHEVRDAAAVKSTIGGGAFDVVVHLAAEVGKLNCENNPARATEVNVIGTLNVAKACAEHGVPLVYVSTSEVYGDHFDVEIDEESGTVFEGYKTSGMYALTKMMGEKVCETYAPDGLKIIRPSMPYGVGVPPGPGRRALDNLIWQALTGQPMIVHRGAVRSWCWVDDVASGFRAVIERGEPGIYNVGRDDDEIGMEDLAVKIAELVKTGRTVPHPRIEVIDPPARQTAVKRISCAKLRALGWEPKTSLDEGLPKMTAWIRDWLADKEEVENRHDR
jgi:nucleoside-diphosphate-sugar epimerase